MTLEDIERVKKAVIRRYPISAGLALNNVKIELSEEVDTAAVVGKRNDKGVLEVDKLVVNPEFFDRLTFSERVFVLAHESLHIALKHFARAATRPEVDVKRKYKEYCEQEPDEEKRKIKEIQLRSKYHKIWNIATDACINAFLKKDGFDFPDNVIDPKTGKKMQFVEMKEGFVKSAEKIYDYLVKKEEEKEEEKEKEKQNGDSQQSNQPGEPSQGKSNGDLSDLDDIDIDDYQGIDSHEEWTGEPSDEKKEGKENSSGEEKESDKENDESSEAECSDEDEDILNKELSNREQKNANSKESDVKSSLSKIRMQNGLADYVPFKPILSWKRLLVGIEEKNIEVWGNRRASRFNPNARIEERTEELRPSVEIVLDVSGSISTDLLRGFLLQLYDILDTIYEEDGLTMKVGTFDDSFSGFTEIRKKEDIAKFSPNVGGGTNFEAAVKAFTPDPGRKKMKIVFTDGVKGTNPTTRIPDIIWIVFGDKMNFTPLGGRIIHVSEEEYKDMIKSSLLISENTDEDSKGPSVKK